ncbi:MAG: aminodeoxychorismate synthase component I [Bacillota bacterium]
MSLPKPLVRELPLLLAPEQLFSLFLADYCSFWLDSSLPGGRMGRFSFMGSNPFLYFKTYGNTALVEESGRLTSFRERPFRMLRELLARFRTEPGELPFLAGAVGFFSYDLGRMTEKLPDLTADDLNVPDICLGFYDRVLVIDHEAHRLYLSATGLPLAGATAKAKALADLDELAGRIVAAGTAPDSDPWLGPKVSAGEISRCFTESAYRQAVLKAKEYIAAGDIYQVNVTQRFSAPLKTTPYQLYRRLRQASPAPFAAYLDCSDDLRLLSSSPERFLLLRDGQVETRPIKGTRPRGRTAEEDRERRRELLASEKDRAELVMIVDLERNDLGRVCSYGTVRVPELLTLEEYATVFHLVSTVCGALAPGKDVVDLLKSTFPGGSITGAPKIRAMEIIEELEPVRRGVYTGAIGYLGFDGRADLNIAIRTMVNKGDHVYLQVGGGIVADSDPRLEYEETLHKARGMLKSLGVDRFPEEEI